MNTRNIPLALIATSIALFSSLSFADMCEDNIVRLIGVTTLAQKVSDNKASPAGAINSVWASVYELRKIAVESCELLGMKMMKDAAK